MFETGASGVPDKVPERKNNFAAVLLHYETIRIMVAEQKEICAMQLTTDLTIR